MQYTVFVENQDGSGRIVLTQTADGDSASELVGLLVKAAMGVTLSIGVQVAQQQQKENAKENDTAQPPKNPPQQHRAGR